MQNDLIHAAAKLFPTYEHWRSFQELANNIHAIKEEWFVAATDRIRQHFKDTLSPEWGFIPYGATNRDTRWFLQDFGPGSLSIRFSDYYRLDLLVEDKQRYNSEIIYQLLKEKEYLPISQAFSRIDKQFDWAAFYELSNFRFGEDGDGHYSANDLAWFAAHEPYSDLFVKQAIAKVEKFTNNPQVTELLRKINQIAMEAAKGEKK